MERENGQLIDCVEIYRQPAFDHPLLRNHTIQMKPSSKVPSSVREANDNNQYKPIELYSGWLKNGEWKEQFPSCYAHVGLDSSGPYYGAKAQINMWNPLTFGRECSFAQFWIAGPNTDNLNTVEAGWLADGYKRTGCYNLDCPGFEQAKILVLEKYLDTLMLNITTAIESGSHLWIPYCETQFLLVGNAEYHRTLSSREEITPKLASHKLLHDKVLYSPGSDHNENDSDKPPVYFTYVRRNKRQGQKGNSVEGLPNVEE
ncbi:hypothetical protein L484_003116 [Morus notabilis]|uniref:Neprosin domain-containing protein n=1 Tax=Morus notabilis TaxID=981085 RepID=W9RTC9_9ROSA|nr:hypothetical protein L484_003116 [Morus notabilis]